MLLKLRLIRTVTSPLFFAKAFFTAAMRIWPIFVALILCIVISGTALFWKEPAYAERVQTFLFPKHQVEDVDSADSLALNKENQRSEEIQDSVLSSNMRLNQWLKTLILSFEVVFVSFEMPREKPEAVIGRFLLLFDHIMGLIAFGLIVYLVTVATPDVARYIKAKVDCR